LRKTIYFKPNSYTIDKKYENSLKMIAKRLNSDTLVFLKVFGYADTLGNEDANDILSEKRANAVYDFLILYSKIDTTLVYVTWLGESEESYDLHFPTAHIQQKSVDIWILFRKKNKH
jgi:outer membrane protein OmpA-like peptidoglycan-associated protein